jgi:hypothetical protein
MSNDYPRACGVESRRQMRELPAFGTETRIGAPEPREIWECFMAVSQSD